MDKKVFMICLKENDTMYVKIVNHTDGIIYIPQNYSADYTNNDDTLHLVTVNKPKYSVTTYYKYKGIYPFEFYTTRQIEGYHPDTIEEYKKQTTYFNQFKVQPIISIKPDSAYLEILQFDIPKYSAVVSAVYYDKPFLNEEKLKNVNYVQSDFLKFDSVHARYINSKMLIRYR